MLTAQNPKGQVSDVVKKNASETQSENGFRSQRFEHLYHFFIGHRKIQRNHDPSGAGSEARAALEDGMEMLCCFTRGETVSEKTT